MILISLLLSMTPPALAATSPGPCSASSMLGGRAAACTCVRESAFVWHNQYTGFYAPSGTRGGYLLDFNGQCHDAPSMMAGVTGPPSLVARLRGILEGLHIAYTPVDASWPADFLMLMDDDWLPDDPPWLEPVNWTFEPAPMGTEAKNEQGEVVFTLTGAPGEVVSYQVGPFDEDVFDDVTVTFDNGEQWFLPGPLQGTFEPPAL